MTIATGCWFFNVVGFLDLVEFGQFVLPHLSPGSRGPAPKLSLQKIFNYVFKHLYLGCQWKELPIDRAGGGRPKTHYTRIYRIWRRWVEAAAYDCVAWTRSWLRSAGWQHT